MRSPTWKTSLFGGLTLVFFVVIQTSVCVADGPEDNDPSSVRAVPPIGDAVTPEQETQLLGRCESIRQQLARLKLPQASSGLKQQIEVLPRSVEMMLATNMVYKQGDIKSAEAVLKLAEQRIKRLATDDPTSISTASLSSTDNPRLAVGGFPSEIDGSIQPFGLVFPEKPLQDTLSTKYRLDVWLHGRGERISEAAFLNQRMQQIGQCAPEGTIVLHPYGRYSNAFKFAGEIDVLEAIEHVKQHWPIDSDRVTIRGFSMGGAGCWQLAVHYPNIWAAANPGAGFSETMEFLKVFQLEDFKPTWYQRDLLHWYDCPDWVNNLRNVPTVAYSGEIDRQKQAADVMAAAYADNGMELRHIIGPDTAHKIHVDSKREIQALLDADLAAGKPQTPDSIDFTTYSLRYDRVGWLRIIELGQHWKEARIQGNREKNSLRVSTSNSMAIELDFPSATFGATTEIDLAIDEQDLSVLAENDGRLNVLLRKQHISGPWEVVDDAATREQVLGFGGKGAWQKRSEFQGPIDDAFMGPFVFVGPDREATTMTEKWAASEFTRAKAEWIRHFRGDIREVAPSNVTEDLLRSNHLIVFGTPTTNSFLAKIRSELPIGWEGESIICGEKTYRSDLHAPIAIYPNPLLPSDAKVGRYIVINSGFTYREYAYLNNARQIPMLPDWAIVDISQGATTQFPGRVVDAGFYDEHWQFQPSP
ncbi:MAG: prolyl oligopeptidase family serine peptidase [Planctomycetota bacterium]